MAPGRERSVDARRFAATVGAARYSPKAAPRASVNSAPVEGGSATDRRARRARGGDNYAGGPNQAVAAIRILGLSGSIKRSVALVGDSIMQGANHDGDAYRGGFALALDGQKVPYVKIAHGGESAGTFAGLPASARRLALIVGCTDAIVQYGANDFTNRSLSAVQADLITIWQRLVRMGITRVKQTTIAPRTTSTDNFATPGNQTRPCPASPSAGYVSSSTTGSETAPPCSPVYPRQPAHPPTAPSAPARQATPSSATSTSQTRSNQPATPASGSPASPTTASTPTPTPAATPSPAPSPTTPVRHDADG